MLTKERDLTFRLDGHQVRCMLAVPKTYSAIVIVLADRGTYAMDRVAMLLNEEGMCTLSVPLPRRVERPRSAARVKEVAGELCAITERVCAEPEVSGMPCGYFSTGQGAAIALTAAAIAPRLVDALVVAAGRIDLADAELPLVQAPVLLVAGERDTAGIERDTMALSQLPGDADVRLVAGTIHPIGSDGARRQTAALSALWFREHFPAARMTARLRADQAHAAAGLRM
jgi:putative phosphoribosyl transferase